MNEMQKKKILIVDDALFLLDVYESAFREAGFEVKVSRDGKEAWDAIEGGYQPDIMFTGILMPRMTGFDLIRKMQARDDLKDIPVVISSHRGREEDKETAKGLGVDDFVVQGLVPLHEVVRRIKALSGDHVIYHVAIERGHHDGDALIALLARLGQVSPPAGDEEVFLEMEPTKEPGEFKVRIVKG